MHGGEEQETQSSSGTDKEQDSDSVGARGRSRVKGENVGTSAVCLEPTKQRETQL